MKNIEVMCLKDLFRDLNIEKDYDYTTPRETLNKVITRLSDRYKDTDVITLLLVDEIHPCDYNQRTADWRHLEVRENVIWLLGLSPRGYCSNSIEIQPPTISSVLTINRAGRAPK